LSLHQRVKIYIEGKCNYNSLGMLKVVNNENVGAAGRW
jgi:hypothetical protein